MTPVKEKHIYVMEKRIKLGRDVVFSWEASLEENKGLWGEEIVLELERKVRGVLEKKLLEGLGRRDF